MHAQDVEVEEVEEVEEAPEVEAQEVKEVQKTQEGGLAIGEVEPTVEQKQEAKLEVIDVAMDKDVEMANQNEMDVAAAGSGRLWKPDTFEQDVDKMLKKRKLKMGTAAPAPEIQTVKTVAAKAPVADPSVSDLAARPADRPARPSKQHEPSGEEEHVEKHVQEKAETKADEKVTEKVEEKVDKDKERAQGGLQHTVLVPEHWADFWQAEPW